MMKFNKLQIVTSAIFIFVAGLAMHQLALADITCPEAEAGRSSNSCLGGQCRAESFQPQPKPCEPPRWWPGFLDWVWCSGGDDTDTYVKFICNNECPTRGGGCAADEICVTDPLGNYPGSGNGLCIADPAATVVSPPPEDPAELCAEDETWVSDPTPHHSGGQCQTTAALVECCYLHSDLTACELGVPTECPGNGICSRSGYCYERNQIDVPPTPPGLQRDPDVYPPPPGEADRNVINNVKPGE